MNITIHRGGQNYGPYSVEEVRQHLTAGSLASTDLAFVEGGADWVTLDQVPGIKGSAAIPPPPVRPSPVTVTAQPAMKKSGGKVIKSCLGCAGLMIVGLVVLAVIGAVGGKADKAPSTSVSTTSPDASSSVASPTTQPSALAMDLSVPPAEKTFIVTVDSFKVPYDSADTEIKKTNVRFNRKDALNKFFSQAGNLGFQGWMGQVQELTTESDGSAYVSIQLAGTNITIKTNNNSLSDMMAHTMIPRGDALYQPLMDLKEGDQVTVSGNFIHDDDNNGPDYILESSVTEEGSMSEPEFIVKFSQIAKK